ncbi:hypothetical protein D9M72_225960 [compost metagenome]
MASMSASVGVRVRRSRSTAAMIWPGWQKPHCGTSRFIQACCTGCSVLPLARPSMVVTWRPRTSDTRTEQVVTALPSTWQVQALHTLMPQPYFGPVMPSLSRSTHSSARSSGASTSTFWPFTLKDCTGMAGLLRRGSER